MTVIGITGAAGELGRRTAQYVLQAHPPQDLVLFSRTPDALAGLTTTGAAARHADFNQADSLTASFTGVDVLLLISTDAVGRRSHQQQAAIKAAAAAGVQRIVYTSTINADKAFPARIRPLTDDHAATEDALRQAGTSWTLLRNSLYLEAISSGWTQAAATGKLITNNGSGLHAPVARDDCAAAAAVVLVGQGHDEAIYNITGRRLIDDAAIATVLASHYGRPIDVEHVADDDYEKGLLSAGLPAEIAGLLTGFGESIRTGLMQAVLGDTDKLIDRPPLSVEQFLAHQLG